MRVVVFGGIVSSSINFNDEIKAWQTRYQGLGISAGDSNMVNQTFQKIQSSGGITSKGALETALENLSRAAQLDANKIQADEEQKNPGLLARIKRIFTGAHPDVVRLREFSQALTHRYTAVHAGKVQTEAEMRRAREIKEGGDFTPGSNEDKWK